MGKYAKNRNDVSSDTLYEEAIQLLKKQGKISTSLDLIHLDDAITSSDGSDEIISIFGHPHIMGRRRKLT